MATYGSNSLAVRFQRNIVDEPQTKSTEMPPGSPLLGNITPGFKPHPGRGYPKAMRNLPWRSWLSKGKPGVKRKKRGKIGSLMG